MAWQSYLAQPLQPLDTGGCQVSVLYYDDADPANAGAGLIGPGQGTAAASTDLITIPAGHGLAVGDQVIFTALVGGGGLLVNRPYTVLTVPNSTTFTISRIPGGSTLDITTNATALTAFKLKPPANAIPRSFFLPAGRDINDLLPDIDQAGRVARAAGQQAAAINGSTTMGTTRPVPA